MHLLKTRCAGAWRNSEERSMFHRYVFFANTMYHMFAHPWMFMENHLYRRIAQVLAVAFTIHFPNEWTHNIKQSRGSWGCCKFGPGMPWPFQSAGGWWLWIRCLVSPNGDTMVTRCDPVLRVIRGEPGEVWLSMEVTQHLLNSGTWGLYLCMLWLQVGSRRWLNRLNIRNSLAKEF